jgi:hypothetical protein
MAHTPDDYRKLKEVFNEAVELEPSARDGYLRSAADTGMRVEVERMLGRFRRTGDDRFRTS